MQLHALPEPFQKIKKKNNIVVGGSESRNLHFSVLLIWQLKHSGTSHYGCLQRCQVSLTQFFRDRHSVNRCDGTSARRHTERRCLSFLTETTPKHLESLLQSLWQKIYNWKYISKGKQNALHLHASSCFPPVATPSSVQGNTLDFSAVLILTLDPTWMAASSNYSLRWPCSPVKTGDWNKQRQNSKTSFLYHYCDCRVSQ